jgi:hypothetical protein
MTRAASTVLHRQHAATLDGEDDDLDVPFPVTELPGKPYVHRRGGKRVHKSSAIRWCLYGIKGGSVKLGSFMSGGARCTTRRLWEQFVVACTGEQATPPPQVNPRDHRRAEVELDRLGIA